MARPGLDALAAAPDSHRALMLALLDRLALRDPDGAQLATAHDLTEVADLAADRALDAGLIWQEHLGSFYDTDGVRMLLGRDGEPISRQAVHKRHGLLALTTGSGRVVYPTFQFRGRRLMPGLDRVLEVLPGSLISGWTAASWLVSPEADLDGERPADVLFEAVDAADPLVDRVVRVARSWAAQLVR